MCVQRLLLLRHSHRQKQSFGREKGRVAREQQEEAGKMVVLGTTFVLVFVPLACIVGIAFALMQWYIVSQVSVSGHLASNNGYRQVDEDGVDDPTVVAKCAEIQAAISEGGCGFSFASSSPLFVCGNGICCVVSLSPLFLLW